MTGPEREQLQTEFEATAVPRPARVTVTVDLEADVLQWLKAQHLDWQQELNNLGRFWMETSNIPVPPPEAYDEEANFETAGPNPPATPTESTTSLSRPDILPGDRRQGKSHERTGL